MTSATASMPVPRLSRRLLSLGLAALLGVAVLAGLGVWQLERRAWKHALIERVEARIHAVPVVAPGPDHWPMLDRNGAEYRHVRVAGRFDQGRETLVKAVTERGPGWWVITPLVSGDGFTVLVNRGFVPSPDQVGRIDGTIIVTGLLRMSEPGGGFLRSNDPTGGRWYSRDVAAIAAARGLGPVAPYFIDADAAPGGTDALPVAGLTVVRFADDHLTYALTWFALALLLAGGSAVAIRAEWRKGPAEPT